MMLASQTTCRYYIPIYFITTKMGNKQSKTEMYMENFDINQWQEINSDPHCTVLASRQDPSYQIQRHRISISNSKQFGKAKELYSLRKGSPYFVNTISQRIKQKKEICTQSYQGELYTQRIPLRLSNITHIPFPDVLHIYNQAFNGYEQLWKIVGPFKINQDCIGLNKNNVVRVWHSSNYEQIQPISEADSEEEMVKNIVNIIEGNTDENSMPYHEKNFSRFLFKDNYNAGFGEAKKKLEMFANQYNGGIVPNYLNCAANAGGAETIYGKYIEEVSSKRYSSNYPISTTLNRPHPNENSRNLRLMNQNLMRHENSHYSLGHRHKTQSDPVRIADRKDRFPNEVITENKSQYQNYYSNSVHHAVNRPAQKTVSSHYNPQPKKNGSFIQNLHRSEVRDNSSIVFGNNGNAGNNGNSANAVNSGNKSSIITNPTKPLSIHYPTPTPTNSYPYKNQTFSSVSPHQSFHQGNQMMQQQYKQNTNAPIKKTNKINIHQNKVQSAKSYHQQYFQQSNGKPKTVAINGNHVESSHNSQVRYKKQNPRQQTKQIKQIHSTQLMQPGVQSMQPRRQPAAPQMQPRTQPIKPRTQPVQQGAQPRTQLFFIKPTEGSKTLNIQNINGSQIQQPTSIKNNQIVPTNMDNIRMTRSNAYNVSINKEKVVAIGNNDIHSSNKDSKRSYEEMQSYYEQTQQFEQNRQHEGQHQHLGHQQPQNISSQREITRSNLVSANVHDIQQMEKINQINDKRTEQINYGENLGGFGYSSLTHQKRQNQAQSIETYPSHTHDYQPNQMLKANIYDDFNYKAVQSNEKTPNVYENSAYAYKSHNYPVDDDHDNNYQGPSNDFGSNNMADDEVKNVAEPVYGIHSQPMFQNNRNLTHIEFKEFDQANNNEAKTPELPVPVYEDHNFFSINDNKYSMNSGHKKESENSSSQNIGLSFEPDNQYKESKEVQMIMKRYRQQKYGPIDSTDTYAFNTTNNFSQNNSYRHSSNVRQNVNSQYKNYEDMHYSVNKTGNENIEENDIKNGYQKEKYDDWKGKEEWDKTQSRQVEGQEYMVDWDPEILADLQNQANQL